MKIIGMTKAFKLLKSKIREGRKVLSRIILKRNLKNKNFTIISNDCWGGEIYRCLNIPYSTPFVGLMILSPCYIKLLENLHHYLEQKLEFKEISKYEYINSLKKLPGNNFPIGVLGDIEIHFLHYTSEQEAFEKWTRRTKRIYWNNIFLKYDPNKDLGSLADLKRFDLLLYPKVSFGLAKNIGINSLVIVDKWDLDAGVFFYLSLKSFDLIEWLNTGIVKGGFLNKINYYLFHKKI